MWMASVDRVVEPTFSVERGFFGEAFQLDVTTTTPGATLVYTTNGEEPSRSVGNPGPADDTRWSHRSPSLTIDKTTTLRVMAFRDDYVRPSIQTQTYFFVDDIIKQSNLWSTVTDDPVWGPQLRDSFLALPSVSLVLDGRISEAQ